jgi:tetratricopeptide (TPR) repeat protein
MRLQKISIPRLLIIAVSLMLAMLPITSFAADYDNIAIPDKTGPAYWLDQGGLFATYGNYPAAIEAYQKVIDLDSENAEAYFDMGVAYGELDEFDSALININKAISLDTGMSRYYYGRAWVYLISGQADKALADFNKAAEMGDLDAILYLKQVNMSR